jgi:membrane protease YdiL (CAAX protease family)
MRPFLIFFALLAAALIGAAFVAYPAWLLFSLISVEPFHRVVQRVAMLIALAGLVVLVRRMQLADRASLGFGLTRRTFIRQMLIAFAAGIATMAPLVFMLHGLELRVPKPGFAWGGPQLLGAVGQGLATGFAVALIEETFFRGALQTAMMRAGRLSLAIVLPSILYASLHFLGGHLRIPAAEVGWSSGFDVLASLFERYAQPGLLIDSFAALVAVGVLLALVRARTGAIAACIGLHAAWVCVITAVRTSTTRNDTASASWLIGAYDGVIGWGAFALIVAITAAYLMFERTRHVRSSR